MMFEKQRSDVKEKGRGASERGASDHGVNPRGLNMDTLCGEVRARADTQLFFNLFAPRGEACTFFFPHPSPLKGGSPGEASPGDTPPPHPFFVNGWKKLGVGGRFC